MPGIAVRLTMLPSSRPMRQCLDQQNAATAGEARRHVTVTQPSAGRPVGACAVEPVLLRRAELRRVGQTELDFLHAIFHCCLPDSADFSAVRLKLNINQNKPILVEETHLKRMFHNVEKF